jgi:hypothetical protein
MVRCTDCCSLLIVKNWDAIKFKFHTISSVQNKPTNPNQSKIKCAITFCFHQTKTVQHTTPIYCNIHHLCRKRETNYKCSDIENVFFHCYWQFFKVLTDILHHSAENMNNLGSISFHWALKHLSVWGYSFRPRKTVQTDAKPFATETLCNEIEFLFKFRYVPLHFVLLTLFSLLVLKWIHPSWQWLLGDPLSEGLKKQVLW